MNVKGALLEVTSTNTVIATNNNSDAQFWCMNTNSTGVTFEEHGGVQCLDDSGGASVVGNCNDPTSGWHLTKSVYSTETTSYFLLENGETKNCMYQNGIGKQLKGMPCQNMGGVTGDVWTYSPDI